MTTQISGTTGVSRVQDGPVTQADLAANVVGNGPAFSAYLSAGQSITSGVTTKINFDAETFDLGACFASSKFTPQVAGYYQINARLQSVAAGTSVAIILLYKNGTELQRGDDMRATTSQAGLTMSSLVYMNGTTDYLEIYYSCTGTTPVVSGSSLFSHFSGFLARAA